MTVIDIKVLEGYLTNALARGLYDAIGDREALHAVPEYFEEYVTSTFDIYTSEGRQRQPETGKEKFKFSDEFLDTVDIFVNPTDDLTNMGEDLIDYNEEPTDLEPLRGVHEYPTHTALAKWNEIAKFFYDSAYKAGANQMRQALELAE